MSDETEAIRRELVAEINAAPGSREALQAEHGQVWDTQELGRDYEVIGFAAPLVVVRHRATACGEVSSSSTIRGSTTDFSRGDRPGDARGSCGQPWEPLALS